VERGKKVEEQTRVEEKGEEEKMARSTTRGDTEGPPGLSTGKRETTWRARTSDLVPCYSTWMLKNASGEEKGRDKWKWKTEERNRKLIICLAMPEINRTLRTASGAMSAEKHVV
jgi:hypothetical protein